MNPLPLAPLNPFTTPFSFTRTPFCYCSLETLETPRAAVTASAAHRVDRISRSKPQTNKTAFRQILDLPAGQIVHMLWQEIIEDASKKCVANAGVAISYERT